jgi:hypothetical protein
MSSPSSPTKRAAPAESVPKCAACAYEDGDDPAMPEGCLTQPEVSDHDFQDGCRLSVYAEDKLTAEQDAAAARSPKCQKLAEEDSQCTQPAEDIVCTQIIEDEEEGEIGDAKDTEEPKCNISDLRAMREYSRLEEVEDDREGKVPLYKCCSGLLQEAGTTCGKCGLTIPKEEKPEGVTVVLCNLTEPSEHCAEHIRKMCPRIPEIVADARNAPADAPVEAAQDIEDGADSEHVDPSTAETPAEDNDSQSTMPLDENPILTQQPVAQEEVSLDDL